MASFNNLPPATAESLKQYMDLLGDLANKYAGMLKKLHEDQTLAQMQTEYAEKNRELKQKLNHIKQQNFNSDDAKRKALNELKPLADALAAIENKFSLSYSKDKLYLLHNCDPATCTYCIKGTA